MKTQGIFSPVIFFLGMSFFKNSVTFTLIFFYTTLNAEHFFVETKTLILEHNLENLGGLIEKQLTLILQPELSLGQPQNINGTSIKATVNHKFFVSQSLDNKIVENKSHDSENLFKSDRNYLFCLRKFF